MSVPHSDVSCRHAGVEVGDALDERRACDLEEEHAVEPVVADAVAAVDGERDGELTACEPAVEGEADLERVAAPQSPQVYLLLLRVRAVGVDASVVCDEEADDGVVCRALKARAHAHRERRARLDYLGGGAGGGEGRSGCAVL